MVAMDVDVVADVMADSPGVMMIRSVDRLDDVYHARDID